MSTIKAKITGSETVKTQLATFRGEPGAPGAQGIPGEPGPAGPAGAAGKDGVSPIVKLERVEDGVIITTTDATGTHREKIYDGTGSGGGDPGESGEDGGYYQPSVDSSGNLTWSASKPNMPYVSGANIRGPRGEAGQDGKTPIKGVDYFDGKDGKDGAQGATGPAGYTPIKGVDYFDGAPGATGATGPAGKDGTNGKDGVSPSVSTSKSGKVTTLTITDASGTKTATINDGADGAPGAAGSDGKDGAAGKDGTSVTVKSVSESSADGGSNVVTFSDGKTLTVKNGSKGSAGSKGDQGDTGRRGTGLLPITTAPSSYTTTVNGLTPAYRIALSTVKTQASTDEVYAGDTLRYSYYHYPIIYVDASYVYCGTRVSIRGASGAAGTTPVKGTDYWTASDKNEITQEVTTELQGDFVKKNQGSSNVGKILVVGADGNLTLTDMPTAMSGDVVGTLDASKNIDLTGDLADGTYNFRWVLGDGTYADIGSLVVGNSEPEPAYVNLADTSAAAGWLNDKRFSTSSSSTETIKDGAGAVITNYIQVNRGQVIRAKGINFVSAVGSITPSVARYNPKSTFVGLAYLGSAQGGTFDSATATSMCPITNNYNSGDYIRICGSLVSGYTASDVIITLDQEIVD